MLHECHTVIDGISRTEHILRHVSWISMTLQPIESSDTFGGQPSTLLLDEPSSRQRPHCVDQTGSHPNSEVKRRKARIVLGWVTAREVLWVLLVFFVFSIVTGLLNFFKVNQVRETVLPHHREVREYAPTSVRPLNIFFGGFTDIHAGWKHGRWHLLERPRGGPCASRGLLPRLVRE